MQILDFIVKDLHVLDSAVRHLQILDSAPTPLHVHVHIACAVCTHCVGDSVTDFFLRCPRAQLPPMAPRRRVGAPKRSRSPGEGSPAKMGSPTPKKRPKKSPEGESASTHKKKPKVVWRMLAGDSGFVSALDFDVDGPGGDDGGVDHDDNIFTAHCDASSRDPAAMADWVQKGASAEGHIDDVVAVDDTFAAKVDEDVEKMDLSVVYSCAIS